MRARLQGGSEGARGQSRAQMHGSQAEQQADLKGGLVPEGGKGLWRLALKRWTRAGIEACATCCALEVAPAGSEACPAAFWLLRWTTAHSVGPALWLPSKRAQQWCSKSFFPIWLGCPLLGWLRRSTWGGALLFRVKPARSRCLIYTVRFVG